MAGSPITRPADWRQRCDEFLAATRNGAFRYDDTGCALMVADYVRHVCGVDPAPQFRGSYQERRAALAHLNQGIGDGLLMAFHMICGRCGFARVPDPATGDLGAVSHENKTFLGVVHGSNVAVPAVSGGVVAFSVDALVALYRIPEAPDAPPEASPCPA